MVSDEPVGWPGVVHREGRTVMRVAERPVEGSRGPAAKGGGTFLNPAMSGSRTRSVLLLQHAIESGMLGDGAIYALDGLAATGVRARRWINELPQEHHVVLLLFPVVDNFCMFFEEALNGRGLVNAHIQELA